MFYFFRWNLIL